MSFADPQTVTINAVTTSLPRVESGENESKYRSGDGTIELHASSQYGKRRRQMLKLSTSKIAADVFTPDENRRVTASVHLVVDSESDAYTNAELLAMCAGFLNQARASSDLLITKLLGGES
nr:MAG: hypothetical protein 2 [Leviviridae sp.]